MLTPLLALALAATPVATPELRTLRVDYFHTGGAAEERFALAGVAQEGRWAGPPAGDRWLDDSNLGKGALYEASGYYRPQSDCIMFTRDEVGFCAVCRRAIGRVIDQYAGRR